MLIYAAQHHGISGLGVTLSKEQAKEANERIARLGLGDRISVRHAHYRDLEQHAERYDRVVSVGCLEHVGKSQNRRFFDVIAKMLKPDGTLVLHTIGKREPAFSFAFGNKYIFPGVYTLTLHEICGHLQRLRFRIHDVENLRIHYSHTARRWLDGFMAHREEFAKQYGEPFVRMFELYLTNGTAYMLWGEDELYQVVATPGIDNTRPLTRDFLTQTEAPAPYVPPARREGAARAGAAKPAATRAPVARPGASLRGAAGRAADGQRGSAASSRSSDATRRRTFPAWRSAGASSRKRWNASRAAARRPSRRSATPRFSHVAGSPARSAAAARRSAAAAAVSPALRYSAPRLQRASA